MDRNLYGDSYLAVLDSEREHAQSTHPRMHTGAEEPEERYPPSDDGMPLSSPKLQRAKARWAAMSVAERHAAYRRMYGERYRATLDREKQHLQAITANSEDYTGANTTGFEVHSGGPGSNHPATPAWAQGTKRGRKHHTMLPAHRGSLML